MQAHPGGGERRAHVPPNRSEAELQPGLFVFEGDSKKCHHVVGMFVEKGRVPLRNYECSLKFCSTPWSNKYQVNKLQTWRKKKVIHVVSYCFIIGPWVSCSCIPVFINLATLHFLIHMSYCPYCANLVLTINLKYSSLNLITWYHEKFYRLSTSTLHF